MKVVVADVLVVGTVDRRRKLAKPLPKRLTAAAAVGPKPDEQHLNRPRWGSGWQSWKQMIIEKTHGMHGGKAVMIQKKTTNPQQVDELTTTLTQTILRMMSQTMMLMTSLPVVEG
jgi:hypothetical protein